VAERAAVRRGSRPWRWLMAGFAALLVATTLGPVERSGATFVADTSAHADFAAVARFGPAWWDAAYTHRRQLTVQTGPTPPLHRYVNLQDGSPRGYSVEVAVDTAALIAAGKVRADCNDLRVLRFDDGWTELDRHVVGCGAAGTRVWFRLQADIADSGSDDSYWLHHGNAVAGVGPADRNAVYLLWEDFSSQTVGVAPQGWTATSGTWRVADDAGNRVLRRTGARGAHWIRANAIDERDVYVEALTRTTPSTEDSICVATRMVPTGYVGCLHQRSDTRYQGIGVHATPLGWEVATWASSPTWHRIGFASFQNRQRFWREGAFRIETDDASLGATAPAGLMSETAALTTTTDFDEVLIRRYTDPEPQVLTGVEEHRDVPTANDEPEVQG
jgi:hypothetical protein